MFEAFIRGNVPSLKNGKIFTGSHLVSSPAIKKWKKESKEDWIKYKPIFIETIRGIERPYFIHLTFIRKINNIWDFTAPTETVADEMVYQNWINDDNIYEFVPCFGRPSINKQEPGVWIRLVKAPKYEFL